jgi:lysozyme
MVLLADTARQVFWPTQVKKLVQRFGTLCGANEYQDLIRIGQAECLAGSHIAVGGEVAVSMILEKEFPDVSFYQGTIDWEVMASKTDAVIIRAGQNTWVDARFRRNWNEAKQMGMKRGTYWFYDDRSSPGAQAQLAASLLQNDPPEMEFWCDWEKSYGGEFTGLKNVVAFMQAVEAKLPYTRVGMYTGYYWFRENSNAVTNASQYAYLKDRPLWLAFYADASQVRVPAPWTSLLLWQYGTPAIGAEYGVESTEIDMNYFNGTQADFDRRYQTPPNGGGAVEHYLKASSNTSGDYRNIRAQAYPNIKGTRIGQINANNFAKCRVDDVMVYTSDVVDGSYTARAGDRWLHVFEANGAPIDGWVAEIHLGKRYLTVEEVGQPAGGITLKHTIEVFSDGSIRIDGKPYP